MLLFESILSEEIMMKYTYLSAGLKVAVSYCSVQAERHLAEEKSRRGILASMQR